MFGESPKLVLLLEQNPGRIVKKKKCNKKMQEERKQEAMKEERKINFWEEFW